LTLILENIHLTKRRTYVETTPPLNKLPRTSRKIIQKHHRNSLKASTDETVCLTSKCSTPTQYFRLIKTGERKAKLLKKLKAIFLN
ncbi:20820_t:CDS:2, partial [Gigaspora margarita]